MGKYLISSVFLGMVCISLTGCVVDPAEGVVIDAYKAAKKGNVDQFAQYFSSPDLRGSNLYPNPQMDQGMMENFAKEIASVKKPTFSEQLQDSDDGVQNYSVTLLVSGCDPYLQCNLFLYLSSSSASGW
jgi:hypothetical protein